jgi:hypothetical protein
MGTAYSICRVYVMYVDIYSYGGKTIGRATPWRRGTAIDHVPMYLRTRKYLLPAYNTSSTVR